MEAMGKDVKIGLPKVAIVGRPNVGKSSLFNRILKKRLAVVYREAGTTRDRISQEATFKGKNFILIDTGGFSLEDKNQILKLVKRQIKMAIEESDILLFVCDGQTGTLPQDFEVAQILRQSNKKILLAVNKVDNEKIKEGAIDFFQLGLDRPYEVSALHNKGIEELLDDLIKGFPDADIGKERKIEPIKVAIVGKPNVGKSSFLNCLLKEERVIVDEIPGTTRDTIDTYLKEDETEFILVDTAGLRHKKKIKEAIDVYSMMRTKEAIKRSQVCLVLIDGYEGLTVDDLKILELVLKEGKCCILCVNKWDLVKELPPDKYKEMIYKRALFLEKYPIIFTSSKTGYNVYNSLEQIKEIIKNSRLKISTSMLNRLLANIKTRGPFASGRNRLKLHYITQLKTSPPTFLIFVNNPEFTSEEHKNFIENLLRKNFGLFGTPIRLKLRNSKGEKI